jgi:hypothetical protein
MKSVRRTDIDILDSFCGHTNRDPCIWSRSSHSFFSRPKLQIDLNTNLQFEERKEERWGYLTEQDPESKAINGMYQFPFKFYPDRTYVCIMIRNCGRGLATNCEARLHLISKYRGCEGFATGIKDLVWENGKTTIDILPKKEKKLYLIFSQLRTTSLHDNQIMSLKCASNEGKTIFPIAWVATSRTIPDILNSEHDSLCLGNFGVHVEVNADRGNTAKKHFEIDITNRLYFDFKNTKLSMSDCNCENE